MVEKPLGNSAEFKTLVLALTYIRESVVEIPYKAFATAYSAQRPATHNITVVGLIVCHFLLDT